MELRGSEEDMREEEGQAGDSRVEERDQWGSKTEYILATAGTIVGLGNFWRFPYLCYKYGGGAFLVPYVISIAVLGVPMFLLEAWIGQYTQEGLVTCWRKLCPLAQGIGYAELLINIYSCAYMIVLTWSLFYLVFSFRSQLPWASCGNTWNTDKCMDLTTDNQTINWTSTVNTTSAATEFWERRVLAMSGSIEEVGSVRWELVLCLIICWAACYFSIWKGVKSTGKVVYFTATFPYVMLLMLLVRGLTLPGAWEGVYYYLYPDLDGLADPQVWMEAGNQVLFSYSIGVGNQLILGSFNKFKNNCYKDCLWLSLLNSGTSFVAGFAVFSVLGFMAKKQGVPIETVAESGPGLAFIVYPQAAAMMPLPQLWSSCLFIMLLLLGVDSQFVGYEAFVTSAIDLLPTTLRRRGRRELFVLLFSVLCFLLNLTLVTQGGVYVFQLIDYYAYSGICIFFMALFESLVMGWIFGAGRVCDITEDMTGQRPCVLFQLCWRYLTPVMCLGSLIFYLVDYKPLKFNHWYVYPDWAYALGWTMALSSILLVPVWGIVKICVGTGSLKQRIAVLCHPEDGLPPNKENNTRHQALIIMDTEAFRI